MSRRRPIEAVRRAGRQIDQPARRRAGETCTLQARHQQARRAPTGRCKCEAACFCQVGIVEDGDDARQACRFEAFLDAPQSFGLGARLDQQQARRIEPQAGEAWTVGTPIFGCDHARPAPHDRGVPECRALIEIEHPQPSRHQHQREDACRRCQGHGTALSSQVRRLDLVERIRGQGASGEIRGDPVRGWLPWTRPAQAQSPLTPGRWRRLGSISRQIRVLRQSAPCRPAMALKCRDAASEASDLIQASRGWIVQRIAAAVVDGSSRHDDLLVVGLPRCTRG